jgi:hypothetical protein
MKCASDSRKYLLLEVSPGGCLVARFAEQLIETRSASPRRAPTNSNAFSGSSRGTAVPYAPSGPQSMLAEMMAIKRAKIFRSLVRSTICAICAPKGAAKKDVGAMSRKPGRLT